MPGRTQTKMRDALSKTIDALDLGDEDAALVELLFTYAEVLDVDGDRSYVVEKCATGFVSALKQLGATPAARAALGKPASSAPVSELDKLRAKHNRQGA